jgi:hypothetical protein
MSHAARLHVDTVTLMVMVMVSAGSAGLAGSAGFHRHPRGFHVDTLTVMVMVMVLAGLAGSVELVVLAYIANNCILGKGVRCIIRDYKFVYTYNNNNQLKKTDHLGFPVNSVGRPACQLGWVLCQ